MRTLSRLVRRYILAAFAVALAVVLVNIAVFFGLIIHFGMTNARTRAFHLHQLADAFVLREDGQIAPGEEVDAQAWLADCAFSMLIGDDGEILWRWNLPEALDRRYTLRETASFTRWYLADYPVISYINDFGVLVTGMPKGSYSRYNFYLDTQLQETMISALLPLLLLDGALILAACLYLGLRSARPLHTVGRGIDELAAGRPVALPEKGWSAELAGRLNRASEHLARQREAIARRDSARTSWIAGVSHDIRTPLSVIVAQAEQAIADEGATPAQRERAGSILAQSQRIRSLIDDLNLTSKLQYGAQPLRKASVSLGALLRRCAADFLNAAQDERLRLTLSIDAAAERAVLSADEALLSRALFNLLQNSARHNGGDCRVTISAARAPGGPGAPVLRVTVADDGAGYPPQVLSALREPQDAQPQDGPHILGLHVVEQIVRAHGGSVSFLNDGGAVAVLLLPAADEKEAGPL